MKTILIADDDPNILAALTRRLEANNYQVLAAPDGFVALKYALDEKPDLMILDMWMPVGIGFSVAERLQEFGLDIPVVFLTASRAPGLEQAAMKIGATAFVEKPYDSKHLLSLIESILARRSMKSSEIPQPQTA